MQNAGQITIPDTAIKFIGLQWPGSAKHAGIPDPHAQIARLQAPTEAESSAIRAFYRKNLQMDWDAIVPALPLRAGAILDIGCGVAGIDVLLFHHYKTILSAEPAIYLLDKSEISENLTYGFSGRNRFYGCLDEARALLMANGVPGRKIRSYEVGDDLPWNGEIDLVISLGSWGFHYPLSTYLDYVRALLLNGGVGITDVRDEKESVERLSAAFASLDVIQRHGYRQRVRFSDPVQYGSTCCSSSTVVALGGRSDVKHRQIDAIVHSAAQILHGVSIIWIGRFLGGGGYGVATRAMYRALKEANLRVVGIDVDTGKPIDDSAHLDFNVEAAKDGKLSLVARDENRRVLSIYHDLPPQWSRLSVGGKVHSVGYTVSETEQIPFNWIGEMLAVDRIWTATEFNKDVFSRAGIAASMITVVPHAVDAKLFHPRAETLPFRAANAFRFLCIVSNYNRKDLGSLIRAYADAFGPDDDVSLIIKLPKDAKERDVRKYIVEPVFPWIDLSRQKVPHVLLLSAHLSEEKLAELYASCHAYVSLERGKGWDLPAIEAMLMGLPTLGVNWSGNTAFQEADNSVLLSPLSRSVFASEDLVYNKDLYTGHTWAAFDITEAAKGFRRLRDEYAAQRDKVIKARPRIEALTGFSEIADLIVNYVSGLGSFEFRSNAVASLRLEPSSVSLSNASVTRVCRYEHLPPDVRELLDEKINPSVVIDDWVGRRRKIWGQYGPVLPRDEEGNRLRSLRNRYLGESIFIIGNGPSLNKIDLAALKEYYTFAANKIYLLFDRTDWRPDFYTTLDWRVTPDNFNEVNKLSGMTFFFPHRFHGMLREGEDVYWYESLSPGRGILDRFETEIAHGVRGGGTVLTAALQIAFFLGFRRLFLIGADVSYSIPPSVQQSGGDRFGTGIQINLESTKDDDVNHFDPRYFGKGAKWHDPNVDAMMRGFQASYRAIQCLGGELYNSTVGGNLECVPRMAFDEALRYASKKQVA